MQSCSRVSQSVVKQIGAAPIFTRCGRATLTPVLEYLVTKPPLKSDGSCSRRVSFSLTWLPSETGQVIKTVGAVRDGACSSGTGGGPDGQVGATDRLNPVSSTVIMRNARYARHGHGLV
jgi:hypothetical protein